MKLVIFMTEERLRHTEQTVNPHEIDVTWEDPEIYGRGWARLYKTDIVMLVEE
jgi:hypothetical protein